MPIIDLDVALPITEGEKIGVIISDGSVQLRIDGVRAGVFVNNQPEISGSLVGGDYVFSRISGSPVVEYWYV